MSARAILAALLLGVVLAPAFPSVSRAQDGPAGGGPPVDDVPVLRAGVDTTVTTVGGRLRVTLDVEMPEGWLVAPPDRSLEFGPFRARSLMETQRSTTHRRFVLTLIATEPGDVEIPPITMQATFGADPEGIEIASDPLPVSVVSNLSAEELASLDAAPAPSVAPGAPGGAPGDPAAGPADVPEPAELKPPLDPPRHWLPVILAGVLAALLGVAAFLAFRAWRARALPVDEAAAVAEGPRRPPWEVALEQLDAIVEAGWVERGLPGRQVEEVTWTLRRYLEDRYGVPALESTTADLRELLQDAPIRGDLGSRVISLLGEADLVKFAKAIPEPSDAQASERHAREIVRRTTPVREEREEAA